MTQTTIDDIDVPIAQRVDRVAIAYVPPGDAHDATNAAGTHVQIPVNETKQMNTSPGEIAATDDGNAVLHINANDKHAPQQLIDAVATLPVEYVLTPSIDVIAETLEDTATVIEYVTDQGAEITTQLKNDEWVTITADDDVTRALTAAAGIARRNNQPRVTTSHAGEEVEGRPGLGFTIEDGHKVKTDEYPEIRATLAAVTRGDTSKRAAARSLETSRRTITRCIRERPEEYNLE